MAFTKVQTQDLQNDLVPVGEEAVSASKYYGTNGSSQKGFHALPVTAPSSLISADAGNDISLGTDSKLFLDVQASETTTTLSQAANGDITYTNEDATPVTAKVISADAGNLLTAGTDKGAFIDAEAVQDAIGIAILNGTGITYDDALNAITATANNITEEFVLDTIGDNFTDTNTIDFTYDDTANSIFADVRIDANQGIEATVSGIKVSDTATPTGTLTKISGFDASGNFVENTLASVLGTYIEEEFTLAAAATTITLANTPKYPAQVQVIRNGLTLTDSATRDYTISGTTITLVNPAFASDQFTVKYLY